MTYISGVRHKNQLQLVIWFSCLAWELKWSSQWKTATLFLALRTAGLLRGFQARWWYIFI